jgi:hypothetical protein
MDDVVAVPSDENPADHSDSKILEADANEKHGHATIAIRRPHRNVRRNSS